MSPVITAPKATASPKKPWAPTPKDRGIGAAVLISAILISLLLVKFTPMKGKSGFLVVFFGVYVVLNFLRFRITLGRTSAVDSIFKSIVTIACGIVLIPIASILYEVFSRGFAGLTLNLFTKDMHSNTPMDPISEGGLLHAIVGTVLLVFVALLISTPIGILTAIYLTEIKGRFARPIRFLVQAMSGVPSIVAGLFIFAAVIIPISKNFNSFQGSLALSILMIPTIARTSEEVLLLVPQDLRESGVALGGTQWRTVAQIVLPAARGGLVTALILGIARVTGETAPLLLLTGGGDTTNFNIFSGPMGSLPSYIWKGFGAGTEESITRAWAGILVLLILVLGLFISARLLSERKKN
jgi:phosphate transport system permease protein